MGKDTLFALSLLAAAGAFGTGRNVDASARMDQQEKQRQKRQLQDKARKRRRQKNKLAKLSRKKNRK